jgi:hypothetical protein
VIRGRFIKGGGALQRWSGLSGHEGAKHLGELG